MTQLNYHAQAELFLGRDWDTARALGPRTFGMAANALRFAFEEAAPVSLRGACLKVGALVYSGQALEQIYRSADYPLERKSRAQTARRR